MADPGAAADALAEAWRFLAPEADEPLVAWLDARGLPAPPPPLRRAGPDGSLRCAAIRALAAAAGAPPHRDPEWGVDDGDWDAPAGAADGGQLDLLRSLPADRSWGLSVSIAAAWRGDAEALRYLRARSPPCPLDENVCASAAHGGHLEVLRWLRAQAPPCPWDEETCEAAAGGGHVGTLAWLRAQTPPCPWGESVCGVAAWNGRLEVLRWLRAQEPPCPWDENACAAAAENGYLEVLRWLRAQDPPCPWGKCVCDAAVRGGHLEVLRWLRAQAPPCPWVRVHNLRVAEIYGHSALAEWIRTQPP